MVMPVGQLSLRHALIGGITATLLWEVTRHLLVWYFAYAVAGRRGLRIVHYRNRDAAEPGNRRDATIAGCPDDIGI